MQSVLLKSNDVKLYCHILWLLQYKPHYRFHKFYDRNTGRGACGSDDSTQTVL